MIIRKTGTCTLINLAQQIDYPGDNSIKEEDVISSTVPNSYRKIIFVRNPYSRIFSSYRHYSNETPFKPHVILVHRYKDFNEFIKDCVYSMSIYDIHFYTFKYYFEVEKGDIEIYRWEEIDNVLRNILKIKNIPHINPPKDDRVYKNMYNLKSKVIISKVYQWDLKKLNYRFNGYGPLPSISEVRKSY